MVRLLLSGERADAWQSQVVPPRHSQQLETFLVSWLLLMLSELRAGDLFKLR